MTMYFPLVVHGAMLIEPTETESNGGAGPLLARRAGLDCAACGAEGSLAQVGAAPCAGETPRRDARGADAAAEVDAGSADAEGGGVGRQIVEPALVLRVRPRFARPPDEGSLRFELNTEKASS